MATGIFNDLVSTISRATDVARAEAPKKVSESSEKVSDQQESAKPAEENQQPSTEQLRSAVQGLNDLVQIQQRALQFSVDENSGRTVITVVDSETDKVIRQIPSEEAIELAQRMQDLQGGLIKTQV